MAQPNGMSDAGAAPLIDRSALDPIMKVTGVAVMGRIVAAFWATTDDMVGAVRGAIDSGDPEAIRKAAHTFKGAASNVGAGRAARIAATMERATPDEARALFVDLEQALAETRPALDAVLQAAA
jgi:HPt (histidine-containing phosphotransfer) domain-containing protein